MFSGIHVYGHIHVYTYNVGELKNLMGILTGKGGSINLEQVLLYIMYVFLNER